MRSALVNILLIICSSLICLLAGEAVVRTLYHYVPNYDFEMWRYAAEMKQPLPLAKLPFYHVPGRKGQYYGVEIRTSSLGLRDREFVIPKPPGRQRIIFLGDSHTLGWGVPEDRTASKLLDQRLSSEGRDIEVINLGVGNFNSSMEVELLKLRGLTLEPDVVVLMYYINDTEPTPTINGLSNSIARHSYLLGYLGARASQFRIMHNRDNGLLEYYRKIYAPGSQGLAENDAAMKELVRLCRERGIRLIIVNIPDLRRIENYPFTFATDRIHKLAEDAHALFLDLLPVFAPYGGTSLWVSPEDPHMNAVAHALASATIYEALRASRE